MGTRRRRPHGHDVLIVLLLGVLAVAAALPAVTLPRADAGDRDEEPGTRQPAGLQADRDSLLSDPRSGVRPLSQLRGPL